jgi:hypothetical protein
MIPHVYSLSFTADKLHNKLHVPSSAVTPYRWLLFVAETCRSIKLCLVQYIDNKFVYIT